MKRLLLAALIVPLLASPASADIGSAPHPADHVFPRGLPAAPSEDACFAYRCVWDARHQGNGEGRSLILTRWHGDEYVSHPITHRRAHRLIATYRILNCEV